MKSLNKDIILKFLLLFFLLIIYICVFTISYADAISYNISSEVFRLHVIANSDSAEDQALKLKVRDAVLDYMNNFCSDVTTKGEAMQIASSNIYIFQEIAENVINSEGFSYPVNVYIGKSNFPTKTYGDVSLPAGIYDALKIEIGSAEGHNWWCVMFPPLCFVDVTSGIVPEESKETLKDTLSDEEYEIITANSSSNNNSKFKFKIVEIVEQIRAKI